MHDFTMFMPTKLTRGQKEKKRQGTIAKYLQIFFGDFLIKFSTQSKNIFIFY